MKSSPFARLIVPTLIASVGRPAFHDPKSLLLALVGEVGEEMADVLLYLVRLADVTGVDLLGEAHAKLEAGRGRFPAQDVHGRAPEKR